MITKEMKFHVMGIEKDEIYMGYRIRVIRDSHGNVNAFFEVIGSSDGRTIAYRTNKKDLDDIVLDIKKSIEKFSGKRFYFGCVGDFSVFVQLSPLNNRWRFFLETGGLEQNSSSYISRYIYPDKSGAGKDGLEMAKKAFLEPVE